MKNPNNPFNIKVGNDVFGSDGMKVGIVVGFDQNCLVVHRGFFFPSDYYIHNGRVARYDEGVVHLTLTLGETLAETDQSAGTAEPTIFELPATLVIPPGKPVYGSDGVRVGKIDHVGVDEIVFSRGFILKGSWAITPDQVASYDGKRVTLTRPSRTFSKGGDS